MFILVRDTIINLDKVTSIKVTQSSESKITVYYIDGTLDEFNYESEEEAYRELNDIFQMIRK